jgi:hypothetical protein
MTLVPRKVEPTFIVDRCDLKEQRGFYQFVQVAASDAGPKSFRDQLERANWVFGAAS